MEIRIMASICIRFQVMEEYKLLLLLLYHYQRCICFEWDCADTQFIRNNTSVFVSIKLLNIPFSEIISVSEFTDSNVFKLLKK